MELPGLLPASQSDFFPLFSNFPYSGRLCSYTSYNQPEIISNKRGKDMQYMSIEQNSILRSTTGEHIALQSVHVEGQLDGLLLSNTIRQNYRNNTGKNLEIVYTFPVGWGTSLLGMDVEIGGKRLQGVVIERKEAEEKYEKAIDEGDTPVMVQEASPGLYTANLGNIKAGEAVSVEVHTAQLLRFEQGQLRVKIPTVIAPRYGDAHKEGGLAPHETAAVDITAAYPFTVRLNIAGECAKAKISSPSHKVAIERVENGISVLLESGGMLDRDFILLLQGLKGRSFAALIPDGEQHVMLASFCPELPVKADPIALKILVDCSGSMSGDSIFQAQKALNALLRELNAQDYVSYSRFGSEVEHAARAMRPCASEALEKLAEMIQATKADMGGTNMEQAVLSTCRAISFPEDAALRPNLLLITDDLYWNDGSMLRAAMESSHRFFTIGVGSAPAECLLRELAEKTGGACEFVTPNEDMAVVIMRMFRRMRGPQTNKLSIEWGVEPVWQSPLPLSIFDGETLHLFATFAEVPTRTPKLTWAVDGKTEYAAPESVGLTENRDIARLAASRRMDAVSKQEALAIALKYQLVSRQTSLLLVYLREGEDKLTDLPEIYQVPQMMAAGSHGFGSVLAAAACCCMPHCFAPLNLAKLHENIAPTQSPQELLEHFDKLSLAHQDFTQVLKLIRSSSESDYTQNLVTELAKQKGITPEKAWAVFLDWLVGCLAYTLSRHAKRLLRHQIMAFEQTECTELYAYLSKQLPSVSAGRWY